MKNSNALPKVPATFRRPPVLVALGVLVVAIGYLILRPSRTANQPTDFYTVKRGDFTVSVVEGGTLNPVSEIVIRSEVEGTARIISIVPEGSYVKKGDLLVELDSAQAQDQVNQQQINFEKARFALEQARAQLDIQRSATNSDYLAADLKVRFAKIELDKYLRGQQSVDFIKASNAVLEAEAKYKVQEETYLNTLALNKKGYEPKQRVDSDHLATLSSRNNSIMLSNSLWILMEFDDRKTREKLEADVYQAGQELERVVSQNLRKMAQAEADLVAQSNTLVLSEQKLERDKRNLKACRIEAPQDGLVVYQMGQGPFSNESMIEGGAVVRNRQELIKLPDLSRMKVTIKVHESHVNLVRPGLPAYIMLDSQADRRHLGYVERVAPLPDTQARWGNPNLKVYTTEVFLNEPIPNAKPGVSAKAEVIVTNLADTLSVPIQAVTTLKGKQVCYVLRGGQPVPQPVTVGLFNTKFIQIATGLEEGDRVLLSPPFDTHERDLEGGVLSEDEKTEAATNTPARPPRTQPDFTERQADTPPAALAAAAGSPNGNPNGDPQGMPGMGRGPAMAGAGAAAGFNREEFMKQYDKNGDGELDETEREAVRAAMAARFGAGGPGGGGQGMPNREEMMKRFDRNGDGQLDDEERAAMRASFGDRPRGQGGEGGGRRGNRGEGGGSPGGAPAGAENPPSNP